VTCEHDLWSLSLSLELLCELGERASRAHFAPRYEPPIPMTITRSIFFAAHAFLTASHSSTSELARVSEGRCFQPRKSLPAPVSFSRTSKAVKAFSTYALYSASFTKELQPPKLTFTIVYYFVLCFYPNTDFSTSGKYNHFYPLSLRYG
jgi:hypothetical protein